MKPLAVLLLLAGAAEAAEPPPFVDRKHGFQLTIANGWKALPLVDTPPEVLLSYINEDTGQLLVVSRIVGPSEHAETDPDLLAGVESGIRKKSTGYQRLSAKKRVVGGKRRVVAWDLWFKVERQGKPVTMGARFLFFRGYALSVLVDSPGGDKPTKPTRKLVESFGPPPPVAR